MIRDHIKEMDIVFDGNEDYFAQKLALKMDSITGVSGEDRQEALRAERHRFLAYIKTINTTHGRGPTYPEIDKLFAEDKGRA